MLKNFEVHKEKPKIDSPNCLGRMCSKPNFKIFAKARAPDLVLF